MLTQDNQQPSHRKMEGSTTRAKARTAKWLEARGTRTETGDDIVCSAWRHVAARKGGNGLTTRCEHQDQVTSLRTNASSGQWLDIQKAALSADNSTRNPIYTGALGEYNGVILRTSQDIPLGCNSSTTTTAVANTRRAVLLGCQAAVCGYGQSGQPNKYRWNEELLDHKRKLEVN